MAEVEEKLKERIADIIFNETWAFDAQLSWEHCKEVAEKICDSIKNELEKELVE